MTAAVYHSTALVLVIALACYELHSNWEHVEHRLFGGVSRSAVPSPAAQLGAIERLVREVRPDVMVDVGCGAGGVLAYVRSYHPAMRLIGIERDEATARLARARVPSAVVLSVDMLEYDPPPPSSATTVCYVMYEPLFEMPSGEAARVYAAFLDRLVAAPAEQRVHVIYASRTGLARPKAFMANEADFAKRGFVLRSRRTNGSLLFRREVRHYER